jgi:5-methyltetrahydropteroyltriglutamate--homocysteine methyltransferase
MMWRSGPPLRADHVGSLIRPPELIQAREQVRDGKLAPAALREIQERAIREVVRQQEEIGLASITDGEFNRGTWQTDFLSQIENVHPMPAKFSVRFRSEKGVTEGKPHALQVTGKLRRRGGIFVDDFRFLASVTKQTPKITLPSPSVLHFRGGREAINAAAYPDMNEFYNDLAQVYQEEIFDLAIAGCRYVQLDEVNFAYLCDPVLQEDVQRNIGEDPSSLPRTYARLINASIASRPPDMAVCLHICRGNFAGNWIAEGGYEPVADVLFNEIDVNGYFLEYDTARAGGFEPLRLLPKGKIVVLGLVTTKKGALESADELKRRIDEASRFVPLEQLALSPQCGFSSGIGGNTMGIEEEFAKLRRVVEVARDVWGPPASDAILASW